MIEWIALCGAGLAVVLALAALARAGKAGASDAAPSDDARRRVDDLREELQAELTLHRRMLARIASGASLTPEAIAEGRLWDDVDAHVAKPALERGEWRALDVRTPQEVARGILPGALCIPVDELERRANELPKDARWLVYCASGGRSAAACEWMSQAGFEEVHNLAGGIQSWPQGAIEKRA